MESFIVLFKPLNESVVVTMSSFRIKNVDPFIDPPTSNIDILNTKTCYNIEVRVMEFKFLPISWGENTLARFKSDIGEILQYGWEGAQAEDLVGFTFENVTRPFQWSLGGMKRLCEIDFKEIYNNLCCKGENSDIFRLTAMISRTALRNKRKCEW